MTVIAQISDTHVVESADDPSLIVDNNGRLAKAVVSLNSEGATLDAVLASGDLVNDGNQAQYERLAELLDPLQSPLLVLPGNHDDVELLRSHFGGTPWADTGHGSWVSPVGAATLVGIDTTHPERDGGWVDDARLAWLDATLASASGSVVVAMHHPPFVTGLAAMDAAGFHGVDELAEVLGSHDVDEVWCGHLHRPSMGWVDRIPAVVCPPTVQMVRFALGPASANLALQNGPAGYLLHCHVDGGWVTHTRYIHPESEMIELSGTAPPV